MAMHYSSLLFTSNDMELVQTKLAALEDECARLRIRVHNDNVRLNELMSMLLLAGVDPVLVSEVVRKLDRLSYT